MNNYYFHGNVASEPYDHIYLFLISNQVSLNQFAAILRWLPVGLAQSDSYVPDYSADSALKHFETLPQNELDEIFQTHPERIFSLLEKLKTLVKEGSKENNPDDKQLDETEDLLKAITMRTKTSAFLTKNEHSKTLDKRDAMTMAKKKHFSDRQQGKKRRQFQNKNNKRKKTGKKKKMKRKLDNIKKIRRKINGNFKGKTNERWKGISLGKPSKVKWFKGCFQKSETPYSVSSYLCTLQIGIVKNANIFLIGYGGCTINPSFREKGSPNLLKYC